MFNLQYQEKSSSMGRKCKCEIEGTEMEVKYSALKKITLNYMLLCQYLECDYVTLMIKLNTLERRRKGHFRMQKKCFAINSAVPLRVEKFVWQI